MSDNSVPSRSDPESLFPPLPPDDGAGRIYVGSDAGLHNLRQYTHSSNTTSGTAPMMKDGTDCSIIESTREKNLYHLRSTLVTFCLPSESTASPAHSCQNVEGQVFVTSRRLFFVSLGSENKEFDLAIDSARISLHAMTSDPKFSVYCQLASDSCPENTISYSLERSEQDGSQGRKGDPGEIHFSPPNEMTDEEKQEFCQGLFDSLSKLASLNPVSDEDDSGGGFAAMMNMMAATHDGAQPNLEGVEGNEDDMICRIDPSQTINVWGDFDEQKTQELDSVGATAEDRYAMLERLDNVLTVPPEYRSNSNYEGTAGQFDDADEDGDELL